MIQQVYEKKEKQNIVRTILEALPDWFVLKRDWKRYGRASGYGGAEGIPKPGI